MSDHPSPEAAPWQAGLRSARANLVPGLVLQAFALAMVLGYYFHAPTRHGFDELAHTRVRIGTGFDIVSTGVFGGLLPLLYLKAMPATRRRFTWAQGAAITAFWSYKGLEVGLWYAFLAWALGETHSVGIVAAKAALDQFVYCPLIAIPVTALVYHGCELHGDRRALWADLCAPRWYARRVLPILCANLGVWVPIVCIIYALPTPLQLPLQNIVLCFFTLMLAHLAQHRPPVG